MYQSEHGSLIEDEEFLQTVSKEEVEALEIGEYIYIDQPDFMCIAFDRGTIKKGLVYYYGLLRKCYNLEVCTYVNDEKYDSILSHQECTKFVICRKVG